MFDNKYFFGFYKSSILKRKYNHIFIFKRHATVMIINWGKKTLNRDIKFKITYVIIIYNYKFSMLIHLRDT